MTLLFWLLQPKYGMSRFQQQYYPSQDPLQTSKYGNNVRIIFVVRVLLLVHLISGDIFLIGDCQSITTASATTAYTRSLVTQNGRQSFGKQTLDNKVPLCIYSAGNGITLQQALGAAKAGKVGRFMSNPCSIECISSTSVSNCCKTPMLSLQEIFTTSVALQNK